MRPFRKAFLVTAVPIAILFGVASGGWMTGWDWTGLDAMFQVGIGLTVAAGFAGFVLAIMRRYELAAGVFAGMGVGFLGLAVTCFAALSNV